MILSIESSAVTASAALAEGDRIIKSEFINAGLTHSETLLPMVKRVMQDVSFSELEAIAVTVGPGSFTGVRIGVAAAKGLAFANCIPCIAVSTLEAIAYNFYGENAIVCACMDARRMQFYNAIFSVDSDNISRITPDRAISIEELRSELAQYDKVILAGDGARLCYENIGLDNVFLAPDDKVYQNGIGVLKASAGKQRIPADELMPVYLRPSQAERELKLKKTVKEN